MSIDISSTSNIVSLAEYIYAFIEFIKCDEESNKLVSLHICTKLSNVNSLLFVSSIVVESLLNIIYELFTSYNLSDASSVICSLFSTANGYISASISFYNESYIHNPTCVAYFIVSVLGFSSNSFNL